MQPKVIKRFSYRMGLGVKYGKWKEQEEMGWVVEKSGIINDKKKTQQNKPTKRGRRKEKQSAKRRTGARRIGELRKR